MCHSPAPARALSPGRSRLRGGRGKGLWIFVALFLSLLPAGAAFANSGPELRQFQRSIIDQRAKLNRTFKKVPRKKTEYSIFYSWASSEEGPVKTLRTGLTASALAGADYKERTTIDIFPDGTIKTGLQISDWDDLPADTRLIVGYRGPYRISRDRPPLRIAGNRYDDRNTVYLFPDSSLRTGNSIGNCTALPMGVSIFLAVDES